MRLHTTTAGDGPLAVGLVHGLGADGATWGPLVDRLVRTGRYTVTAVDLRGHGESERSDTYSLDDLAADLVVTLPTGMHGLVGHSLGGAVLVRAVERLRPTHAVYLDPGFQLSLPTNGVRGRLFWAVPTLTVGVAALLQARRGAAVRRGYDPAVRALSATARERFDSRMAIGVFREVAHRSVPVEPPAVPSTVVLSDDSAAVLPDPVADRLAANGWIVRRLPGIHHDMQLEDPDRVARLVDEILAAD